MVQGGQNRRRFRLRHRPSPDKSARSDAGGGGGGAKPAEISPTTHDLPSVTVFGEEKYVVYWNMTKPPDWGSLVQPPVELASTRKVPVEPVVLKRKAKSPWNHDNNPVEVTHHRPHVGSWLAPRSRRGSRTTLHLSSKTWLTYQLSLRPADGRRSQREWGELTSGSPTRAEHV